MSLPVVTTQRGGPWTYVLMDGEVVGHVIPPLTVIRDWDGPVPETAGQFSAWPNSNHPEDPDPEFLPEPERFHTLEEAVDYVATFGEPVD